MENINIKMQEYKLLLNFNDDFYGKDFKNNYKFTNKAVKIFIKKGVSIDVILNFLEDTIRIHKSSY